MLSEVIESKYITLKNYLKLYFEKNTFMGKEDVEMIIKALEYEEVEENKEGK